VDLHFGLTNLPATLLRMPSWKLNRHFVVTNTPTKFTCCSRRMPGFEDFWFSYLTSSAETSFTQGNAVSWQNRSDLRVRANREMMSPGWRAAPRPRGRTHHFRWHRVTTGKSTGPGTRSKFANFAGSLLVNGEEAVTIPMSFLPEENRRHGLERLMANGWQLVWRMRYRNMPAAERVFPRIRPSWIDSPPIYSLLFNGIPIMMFAPSCGR